MNTYHNGAGVHNDDPIAVDDGVEPMSHCQYRAFRKPLSYRILYNSVSAVINIIVLSLQVFLTPIML